MKATVFVLLALDHWFSLCASSGVARCGAGSIITSVGSCRKMMEDKVKQTFCGTSCLSYVNQCDGSATLPTSASLTCTPSSQGCLTLMPASKFQSHASGCSAPKLEQQQPCSATLPI
eukprot:1160748-Pelagomonas_calceolata.AAC.5